MARTIAVISQTMFDAKAAETTLAGLTSTSQTSTWRLWIYIVAACISVLEQLQDVFKTQLETIAANAVPGSPGWVQNRSFLFQYDAAIPQVIQVLNTELAYQTVNTDYQIVTRCSVETKPSKIVDIKIAKATSTTDATPIPLVALEEAAFVSYWGLIGFSGITYNVINLASDKIGVIGEVFYKGQYSGTIQADIVTAIAAYLANIDFNGSVDVLKLVDAIQATAGVSDFALEELSGRADTTLFASRVIIYDLSLGTNLRQYLTYSGYCVEETTASQDWLTTITFTAV